MKCDSIDIVITWVDGNDTAWQQLKKQYSFQSQEQAKPANEVCEESRYRDPGTLKYVFRSIEKYAPWVRKIFLVTCGQVPEWLLAEHPQVQLVNHTDYIPQEYLPTFSSHVIEMNFHRIEELSEQFIYFNDDTLLTAPTLPEDFFIDGLPCDSAVLCPIIGSIPGHPFVHYLLNDIQVVNGHFRLKDTIHAARRNWYSLKYGKFLLKNILYSFHAGCFLGFQNFHMPAPHLKSTFAEIWSCEPEILHKTCMNRFRGLNDVNPYLATYFNFCSNKFVPASPKRGRYYDLNSNFEEIYDSFVKQKYKFVAINDCDYLADYALAKKQLIELLEKMYPQKSSFEV